MNGKKIRLFCLFFILVYGTSPLNAQRITTKRINTDSVPEDVHLNIYDFKNINKLPDYYNAEQLKRINKLDQEEDWEGLYKALKAYVSKFGIQNFYKDTKLIWRLAKLTELFGDDEEAKNLYRLVLRASSFRHQYEGD